MHQFLNVSFRAFLRAIIFQQILKLYFTRIFFHRALRRADRRCSRDRKLLHNTDHTDAVRCNGRMADEIEKRGLHFAYTVTRDMINARRGWSSLGLSGPAAGEKKTCGPPSYAMNYTMRLKERGRRKGREREREILLFVGKKMCTPVGEFWSLKIFMTLLRCSVSRTNIELNLGELYFKKCRKCVFVAFDDFPYTYYT